MTTKAEGRFTITLHDVSTSPEVAEAGITRRTLKKTWEGDLDGTSVGELLAYRAPEAGSAGYVAVERFVGRLAGREGSFVLAHRGLMDRGEPSALVNVVPGSGTEGLVGLRGECTIRVEAGVHLYVLTFTR